MSLNVSIVLYETPVAELNFVLSVLLKTPEVNRIYLIDNGDIKRELPFADPRIDYRFMGRNLGFGTGHNIAIRESIRAGVPFHLVMNSDVAFKPEQVGEMVRYIEQKEDVACLMPNVQYPTGNQQYLCKMLPTPMDLFGRRFLPELLIKRRNERYELRDTGYDKIMDVPALSGCFLMCRTSALEAVGGFDETFFLYCEDLDLTRRMHRCGRVVFYPKVTIMHDFRRSSYQSPRLLWTHIRSACYYFDKFGWWRDEERDRINRQSRLNLKDQ